VNGAKLTDMDAVEQSMASLKVGAKVQMTVFRDAKIIHVDVAIVERPTMPWDLPNRRTDSPGVGFQQGGRLPLSGSGAVSLKRVIF
jgi:predicted metalloprotease with PDZ domain